jgi:hypothetical protein
MIYHYVNLLNWHWINSNTSRSQSIISIDSLSLWLCIRLITKEAVMRRQSGVRMWQELDKKEIELFLVARSIGLPNECVLPMLRSSEDIAKWYADNEEKLKSINKIVIGISSPRQDELAVKISSNRNDKEELDVYCFGAAVYNDHNLVFDKLRMNWLAMLFKDARRFMTKIKSTILELLSLLRTEYRSDFKVFIRKFII